MIVFATNNESKLREARQILPAAVEIKTLREIGCLEELPETSPTIEGNALQKARYVWKHYGCNCFADDTGLEVEALHGAPGVFSARYASLRNPGIQPHDSEANTARLLSELQGEDNRRAHFRTVVALIIDGKEHLFEGTVEGSITRSRHGSQGFGYDPVFRPDGYKETFAEMEAAEKNSISHRGRAMRKLAEYLCRTEREKKQ